MSTVLCPVCFTAYDKSKGCPEGCPRCNTSKVLNINLEIAKAIHKYLKERYSDYSSKVHTSALVGFNLGPAFTITIFVNDGKLEVKISLNDRSVIDLADPGCFEIFEQRMQLALAGYQKPSYEGNGLAQCLSVGDDHVTESR